MTKNIPRGTHNGYTSASKKGAKQLFWDVETVMKARKFNVADISFGLQRRSRKSTDVIINYTSKSGMMAELLVKNIPKSCINLDSENNRLYIESRFIHDVLKAKPMPAQITI